MSHRVIHIEPDPNQSGRAVVTLKAIDENDPSLEIHVVTAQPAQFPIGSHVECAFILMNEPMEVVGS